MPIAWAPTVGRVASNVCIAAWPRERVALAGAREPLVELLLAAEQAGAGDAAVVEEHVGGVRGAQAVLLDLRAHRRGRRVPGGTTNAACPREPSSRSTDATTTWTPAMPPLVAHAFWPLSTHSSLASS